MRHFCTCLLHSPTPAEWVDPPPSSTPAHSRHSSPEISPSLWLRSRVLRGGIDQQAATGSRSLAAQVVKALVIFFILFVASGRWQLVSLTCWTELCLSGLFCLCSDIYFCGVFFESLTDSQQPICQPRKYFLDVFWRLSTARRPGRVENLVARVWTIYLSLSVGCG